ncbi:YbaB/EbfC family nucleoid-associated protein [Sphaerobacter sp.]|uniref:YbaB/EbfC family nucleoid-associated protein n=1 Tax=Sphaerobacter sp. TaxID=2099654 RepID=UPI001D659FF6|nr:YbaB/EbfC family nucleoid-associated protein [Sphaerobacter sp.]MBX5445933.1 YbaB/EbfC family nucleoid-associated protein [Sphaerobacter sp.]
MQPNMKMLQQMQNRLLKMQQELEEATVEGSAGGGAVRVVVNGTRTVKSISIDPEAVDPDDIEILEDMVLTAINDAMAKAEQLAAEKMGAITGGLNIPGIM